MPWLNVASIPISDQWQYTALIDASVEWIRVRHTLNSDPLFINYGYITQANNFKDFADFRRIYPTDNNSVIEFKRPPSFDSRRIAIKRRNGVKTNFFWLVNIDVWT